MTVTSEMRFKERLMERADEIAMTRYDKPYSQLHDEDKYVVYEEARVDVLGMDGFSF